MLTAVFESCCPKNQLNRKVTVSFFETASNRFVGKASKPTRCAIHIQQFFVPATLFKNLSGLNYKSFVPFF
jgi:hypothetical protein